MIRIVGNIVGNLFSWLVISAVALMVLAMVLIMLGGSCWIAFAIWRAVFGFFM